MWRALGGILKSVFTAIGQFLLLAGKIVYRTLKFLHIRLLALYVLVCAILSAFLPVFGERIVYFWVGFALFCAVTAVSWVITAKRALAAKPRRTDGDSERESGDEEDGREEEREAPPAELQPKAVYPRYFDVAGSPQYFFAEFEDRYELYKRDGNGYTYVRTDKKT